MRNNEISPSAERLQSSMTNGIVGKGMELVQFFIDNFRIWKGISLLQSA